LALLGGAGLAGLTRWLRLGAEVYPLRPPGAAPESRFPGLCVRCGNCITVCPQRILAADLGQSGLGGFLTPIVDYERDYCDEWCAQCTRVCPSGALRPMALADKRRLVMGNARIDKTRCLAWSQQRACMVCSEFCPYLAIRAREQQGVPCPEVILEVCRGCGACQKHCPALPQKAIRVQGLAQRRVTA
jgi:Pyruvate/2-oxoacid:ferredoxin oxidoreductase delta subunit